MSRLWGAPGTARRLHSQMLRRHLGASSRYFAWLLAGVMLQVPVPFLISDVIDGLDKGLGAAELAGRIGLIVSLSLGSLAVSTFSQIRATDLGRTFLRGARLQVFAALQHAPAAFARRFNVSDLQARMAGDLATINHLSPPGLAMALRHVCCLLVFGSVLLYISPAIFLCIVGLLPLAGLVFRFASPRQAMLARQAHRSAAAANATMLESLQGLREGRVSGARQFHFDRLGEALAQADRRLLDARNYSSLMFGALGVIPALASAMIWGVGAWEISGGGLTVGELVSFVLVLSILYGPINGLFTAASGYVFEWAAFERVAALCAAAGTAARPDAAVAAVPAPAADAAQLTLRDVCFDYGGAAVLENLDAQVRAGACTVLAGPNGCGKSTFVSLACAVDVPVSGSVLLDGLPLASYPDGALAARIGYLPQDVLIFGDTLRMNIALGRAVGDESIMAAAEALQLAEFIRGWPEGLDTVILESGRDLSGGQRQKIALLRAVAHQPSLLILDEPENNLDRDSLQHLVHYVAGLKGRCTVLLVTHGTAFQGVIDHRIDLSAARTGAAGLALQA